MIISDKPYWPRWSPDDSRLRFTVEDTSQGGVNSLWEVNADGSNLHPLLPGWNNPAAECCGNWTVDGRYFVFRSTRNQMSNFARCSGDSRMPSPLYEPKSGSPLLADQSFYGRLGSAVERRTLVDSFIVPIRSGKAWPVRGGQVCRIVAVEGPQVVDFNAWNLHNPRERFWAARTKQLHSSHMRVLDRFWSCLPYLRPMATVTGDSIGYGIDEDGAGCHDLLGTRCDPYIHKMLTGEELDVCCHSNLVRAVAPWRLCESDVHDVLNIFQVTGLTGDGHQYFVKPCPARKGDYFEFFAEIDLLAAISTCPHGDMTVPTWGPNAADPIAICRPIGVEVYSVDQELLEGWSPPPVSDYGGLHGFEFGIGHG